jgi:hypothetical protein
MRKLSPNEDLALRLLRKHGPLVPGDSFAEWSRHGLVLALDGLVRKKRATVEGTDDGPRYSLTSLGAEEAV